MYNQSKGMASNRIDGVLVKACSEMDLGMRDDRAVTQRYSRIIATKVIEVLPQSRQVSLPDLRSIALRVLYACIIRLDE